MEFSDMQQKTMIGLDLEIDRDNMETPRTDYEFYI